MEHLQRIPSRSILAMLLSVCLVACFVLSPICAAKCSTSPCSSTSSVKAPEPCHPSSVIKDLGTHATQSTVPCSNFSTAFLFSLTRTEDYSASIGFLSNYFTVAASTSDSSLSAQADGISLRFSSSHSPCSSDFLSVIPLRI